MHRLQYLQKHKATDTRGAAEAKNHVLLGEEQTCANFKEGCAKSMCQHEQLPMSRSLLSSICIKEDVTTTGSLPPRFLQLCGCIRGTRYQAKQLRQQVLKLQKVVQQLQSKCCQEQKMKKLAKFHVPAQICCLMNKDMNFNLGNQKSGIKRVLVQKCHSSKAFEYSACRK